MHRLEQADVASDCRVKVGARRKPEATGERRAQIGQDVSQIVARVHVVVDDEDPQGGI